MKDRLAKIILEKSYREGEFLLTSGRTTDYYFDCKPTALYPEGAYLIGSLFCEMLAKVEVQGVGGMTLGADPLVSAVTVMSYLNKRPLPGFIVRKQSKGHGTNQYLEGLENFKAGAKVAMLEDVVTTGGTLLKACERVRDAGLEIVAVLTVLDRQEGGRENLAMAGYDLKSIFTRADLTAAKGA